ncbi:hypothetical protein HK102_013606 [Quaeritorhiza haematococci]|nr:hypothetical protein HK102_013606 [Quaeritorhiza haematococci]
MALALDISDGPFGTPQNYDDHDQSMEPHVCDDADTTDQNDSDDQLANKTEIPASSLHSPSADVDVSVSDFFLNELDRIESLNDLSDESKVDCIWELANLCFASQSPSTADAPSENEQTVRGEEQVLTDSMDSSDSDMCFQYRDLYTETGGENPVLQQRSLTPEHGDDGAAGLLQRRSRYNLDTAVHERHASNTVMGASLEVNTTCLRKRHRSGLGSPGEREVRETGQYDGSACYRLPLLSERQRGFLQACPEDILIYIFHHLDATSLCRATQVCQYWYNLISHFENSIWSHLTRRTWNVVSNGEKNVSWKYHYGSHHNIQLGRYTFASFRDDYDMPVSKPPERASSMECKSDVSQQGIGNDSSSSNFGNSSPESPRKKSTQKKYVMAWPSDPSHAYIIALDGNKICWVDPENSLNINVAVLEDEDEETGQGRQATTGPSDMEVTGPADVEVGSSDQDSMLPTGSGDVIFHQSYLASNVEESPMATQPTSSFTFASSSNHAGSQSSSTSAAGDTELFDYVQLATESMPPLQETDTLSEPDSEDSLIFPTSSKPITPQAVLTGHQNPIGLILSNMEGTLVSFDDSSMIMVWDLKTNRFERAINANEELGFIFSMNIYKRRIVTGGKNGKVIVWNADTGGMMLSLDIPAHYLPNLNVFNLLNVAIWEDFIVYGLYDGTFYVHDMKTRKRLYTFSTVQGLSVIRSSEASSATAVEAADALPPAPEAEENDGTQEGGQGNAVGAGSSATGGPVPNLIGQGGNHAISTEVDYNTANSESGATSDIFDDGESNTNEDVTEVETVDEMDMDLAQDSSPREAGSMSESNPPSSSSAMQSPFEAFQTCSSMVGVGSSSGSGGVALLPSSLSVQVLSGSSFSEDTPTGTAAVCADDHTEGNSDGNDDDTQSTAEDLDDDISIPDEADVIDLNFEQGHQTPEFDGTPSNDHQNFALPPLPSAISSSSSSPFSSSSAAAFASSSSSSSSSLESSVSSSAFSTFSSSLSSFTMANTPSSSSSMFAPVSALPPITFGTPQPTLSAPILTGNGPLPPNNIAVAPIQQLQLQQQQPPPAGMATVVTVTAPAAGGGGVALVGVPIPEPNTEALAPMTLALNGHILLTNGSQPDQVALWDLTKGEPLYVLSETEALKRHEFSVPPFRDLKFAEISHDGTLVFGSVSFETNLSLLCWDFRMDCSKKRRFQKRVLDGDPPVEFWVCYDEIDE